MSVIQVARQIVQETLCRNEDLREVLARRNEAFSKVLYASEDLCSAVKDADADLSERLYHVGLVEAAVKEFEKCPNH